MNDKKHIDRLFQERFKDFEVAPSDAVWKKIEAELNQKKKKQRAIPIWWRYAGVAALLLLLLTIGFNYLKDPKNTIPINQVVETEATAPKNLNLDGNNSIENPKEANKSKTLIVDNNDSSEEIVNTAQNQASISQEKLHSSSKSTIAKTSFSNNKNESNFKNVSNHVVRIGGGGVIANLSEEKTTLANDLNNKENASAVSTSNVSGNTNENVLIDTAEAKKLINNSQKDKVVAENNDAKSETSKNDEKENNAPTIEQILEKNKDLVEKEKEKQDRWSLSPNAAPVYFNTLSEGSSIDPQFNKNQKTGALNMSYGLSASYAINNKITVRSGINKVNLGYNTNDVIVYQTAGLSSGSRALKNVSPEGNLNHDIAVSVISAKSLSRNTISADFSTSNSSINQSLGYIEIPLEIQYTLSDKKLGVNVIGGFSSFFLNTNEIYTETENGTRTFLGEANNINNISYSANFGLGFNYHISKKIDLNLEPMFKYQINTFKNTSGNFTPFIIGVYTGFAIKF